MPLINARAVLYNIGDIASKPLLITVWTSLPRLPIGMRIRRPTPLFEILGRIIGPVSRLLLDDGGQVIEEKTSDLNEAQANMSYKYLVGKQTHVVRI